MKKNIKLKSNDKKIKSPCNNTCKYDKSGLCVGCYRTRAEIVDWIDLSEEQKAEILLKVAERKKI